MAERPITIPKEFWHAMSLADQAEAVSLDDRVGLLLPSGSRYICPGQHRPDSDFDLYALADPQLGIDLIREGRWTSKDAIGLRGEPIALFDQQHKAVQAFKQASRADGSMAFRFGELNLILFFHPQRFSKFKEATDLCRSIGVTKRDDRVKIFKIICDEVT